MEIVKVKKLNLLINISTITVIFLLLFTSFVITNGTVIYYLGIICRVIMGLWCIFNGIWNSCTDYYSILKNNRFQKNNTTPKWAWWILFIVGIGCLITAFMGYGFNNVKKPI
ncbi:hypothetical protein [Clostridium sp. Marseille-P299]|uniref:hypothetical protein n=1 Tax=Clostridium sp. Marseille-P299 TaxID=1805477 RepID=UPI00082C2D2D|nr:hypothetical protein [Clostridium sp. Marseille-P299]